MGSDSHVIFVSVTLLFTFAVCCVSATPQTAGSPVAKRQAAKQLVQDIHTVVSAAKNGQYLSQLYKDVLELQAKATTLIQRLPGDVSQCETNSVIKMAAAGTGSHEVLTVMLAQDALSVLNGRLSLSLAFLEKLAGQLEDEVMLNTGEIGPYVAAIAFGADTTAKIIDTADKAVKARIPASSPTNSGHHSRVRRQSIKLGSGWSLGLGGAKWQSRGGSTTFNVKPTWSGFKPSGVRATLTFRF